jgi:hypothetical protein
VGAIVLRPLHQQDLPEHVRRALDGLHRVPQHPQVELRLLERVRPHLERRVEDVRHVAELALVPLDLRPVEQVDRQEAVRRHEVRAPARQADDLPVTPLDQVVHDRSSAHPQRTRDHRSLERVAAIR